MGIDFEVKRPILVGGIIIRCGWVTKTKPIMSVIELHHQGIIHYLFRTGLVSSSMVTYIGYYEKFLVYRNMGKTYRESVRLLSEENRVSETTIKKAVRIMEGTVE